MLEVVRQVLQERRSEGWLVGGSLRDRELGRYSPDLDLVVADDPAAVAREIAAALEVPWFALSERHSAYRVVGRGGHVDVAALRGGDITADLGKRDFTINAMALPLSSPSGGRRARGEGRRGVEAGGAGGAAAGGGQAEAGGIEARGAGARGREAIVDPFHGLTHLREGRLVAVSEQVFIDDPLRLMRAARFVHALGFQLDKGLARLMKSQAPLLAHVAAERVAAEMILTLSEGRAAEAVETWRDLGLLQMVLPEITPKQLKAALPLLRRVDLIMKRPLDWFPGAGAPLLERLRRPVDGAVSRPVALRLAALMHGLAPEEAWAAGRRLKLSGEMLSLLRAVSTYFQDQSVLPTQPVGRPAVLFLWSFAPWEAEVILLAGASVAPEREGAVSLTGGAGPGKSGHVFLAAQNMMALWSARTVRPLPPAPLDGAVLMRELGLTPGPLVGRALREVRLAWEAGEATTLEELLAVARRVVAAD